MHLIESTDACRQHHVTCTAANGYDVDYLRVPVTDEKAPKTSDFAILAARAWAPPEGAALVFNCQVMHVIGVTLSEKAAAPTWALVSRYHRNVALKKRGIDVQCSSALPVIIVNMRACLHRWAVGAQRLA